jgi:hypothetical protein
MVNKVYRISLVEIPKSVRARLLDFVEHPLAVGALFAVSGLVGTLLYTPFFALCAVSVLLAFHRAKVVSGQPMLVQIIAYSLLVSVLSIGSYFLYDRLSLKLDSVQTDFARKVASVVKATQSPSSVSMVTPPAPILPKPHPFLPSLTYTDSPALTESVKKNLQLEIGTYSSYLKGIGFPFLDSFPIMGTVPYAVPMMEPGRLDFGEKSIHDDSAIRAAFGMYYFNSQIAWVGQDDNARRTAAIVYNVYFLESYSDLHEGKDSTPSQKWVDALWDIRSKFGKNTTDKALFVGFNKRSEISKTGDTNRYLTNIVESGLFEVLNDRSNGLKVIRQVLSDHGLIETSQ